MQPAGTAAVSPQWDRSRPGPVVVVVAGTGRDDRPADTPGPHGVAVTAGRPPQPVAMYCSRCSMICR